MQNFELKDQYDKSHEVKFPSSKVVVLIFGDRKGAKQIGGWAEPLYERYGGKIYVFGIAQLSGVPGFARGLVRLLLKRQTSYSVMLDWSGSVSEDYGCEKGIANVFVIGKNGRLLNKHTGPADQNTLDALYQEIDHGL